MHTGACGFASPRLCDARAGTRGPARLTLRFGVVIILVVVATIAARANLQLNISRSLPIGLYQRAPGKAHRGDLLVVCLSESVGRYARDRGYLWKGNCPGGVAPLGKAVLALPGDTVTVGPGGLYLNGLLVPRTRPVARDSRGRAVAHYPFGRYVVGRGDVWLFSSHHPMSFDSRYFGPVSSDRIRARIRPLWTRGDP
jgi:conjugative transfer signal peptidase TraF